MYDSLSAFMQRCAALTQADDIWRETRNFLEPRGVTSLIYYGDGLSAGTSGAIGLHHFGLSKAWIRQYQRGGFAAHDPVRKVVAQSTMPFFWSEVGCLKKLTRGEEAYLELLLESDLGDGLAMRVHGPSMVNAVVCMGFGKRPDRPGEAETFEFQCAVQIAHMRHLMVNAGPKNDLISMSPREIEILRWIARGKSTPVIAEILGISRHTVDTLMRRIFEKLSVHDRTAAAVKGLQMGLLEVRGEEIM